MPGNPSWGALKATTYKAYEPEKKKKKSTAKAKNGSKKKK